MKQSNWMVFFLLMSISGVALGDYKKLTEKGNEAYTKSNMEEALKLYREAEIEKPKQPVLDYNIGTALYNQNKYDEALQRYGKAVFSDDPKFQADAFYNMGSTFFRAEKYQEAIAAFQKCLETSPDDVDAKYNLELARKKLKEQAKQQEQKQDKNQQQKQDQQQRDQKKQEQQDQQKDQQQQQDQDQQKQQEQQQQEQQQQGEDKQKQDQQSAGEKEDQQKEQEQQQKQGQQQKEGMSKQDAERILNAISGDEKDLQKKMRRVKVNAAYKGKDW